MMKRALTVMLCFSAGVAAGDYKKVTLPITRYEYAVTANLDRAAEIIGNFRLPAGGEFSLNALLGPRKAATGYFKAPAFGGSGVSVLEFGGGLCMVSSALYTLFLAAGLDVTERHPHQRVVKYIEPGFDATIDFASKDLRAKNTLPFPIMIRLTRHGRFLTAELTALEGGKFSELITLDRDVAHDYIPGAVSAGFRVRTMRVFATGKTQRRQVVSDDTFLPVDTLPAARAAEGHGEGEGGR